MFDNPITFSLLIASLLSLGYFLVNRTKEQNNPDPNKNMKYVLVFGIVFIVCLIGKMCFSGKLSSIEKTITESVGGGEEILKVSEVVNDVGGGDIGGGQPPF
jgi:hypothetical protein